MTGHALELDDASVDATRGHPAVLLADPAGGEDPVLHRCQGQGIGTRNGVEGFEEESGGGKRSPGYCRPFQECPT
jgi:hypothetical protein